VVDGAGKIHDVAGVAVANRRQHQHFFRHSPASAASDFGGADNVYVERQVRPMLLYSAAGHDADFSHFDGIVDFGPGQLFIAILGLGTAGHDGPPLDEALFRWIEPYEIRLGKSILGKMEKLRASHKRGGVPPRNRGAAREST